jgi:hypothetical protein
MGREGMEVSWTASCRCTGGGEERTSGGGLGFALTPSR